MSDSTQDPLLACSGRRFTVTELELVRETVSLFPRLPVTELADTLCELLSWVTPNGTYKTASCRKLLETLEAAGEVELPRKRARHRRPQAVLQSGPATDPAPLEVTSLAALGPVRLHLVTTRSERDLWQEYVQRYHPLGYKQPFGAHLRYFVFAASSSERPLGCLLFAASAWALACRDTWIGWTPQDRSQRLHLIVNNTRFLLFPWVSVPHLASKVLSLVSRRLPADWQERYGHAPVLLETFVDPAHYRGTCYKAANWIEVGVTQGRGRQDRQMKYLSTPKRVYMYPLVKNFRSYLRGTVAACPDSHAGEVAG